MYFKIAKWIPLAIIITALCAVMTKYNKGFVLAGRSLREVEKRENWLFQTVVIAWGLSNFTSQVD